MNESTILLVDMEKCIVRLPILYFWFDQFHLQYFDFCIHHPALFRETYYFINTIINSQPATEWLKLPNHFYQCTYSWWSAKFHWLSAMSMLLIIISVYALMNQLNLANSDWGSKYSAVISEILILTYFNIWDSEAEYSDITVQYLGIRIEHIRFLSHSWIFIFLRVRAATLWWNKRHTSNNITGISLRPWINQITWKNPCKSICKINFLFQKISSCKFGKYNRWR